MAFPATPLGTVVQMQINGVWTSVVRYDTNTKILLKEGVIIKRGESGSQDKTPAGTCNWKWEDPNGIFNNENPRSPYYNLLPRNTPVRVYVPRPEAALYILSSGSDMGGHGRLSTPDSAALSITGDMEVRFDIEPFRFTRYYSGETKLWVIGGKYAPAPNRTWYVRLGDPGTTNCRMAFSFSTTGSNSAVNTCDADLPTTGRISIKITVDVDNGAGSREVKFWTSTTGINGTYTQLGTTQTGAVVSFPDTTAPLQIGTVADGDLSTVINSTGYSYFGRIYGFQLWNGIAGSGGTKVAEADLTGRANGTTSFADGLGNTWTLAGTGVEITNADYRFHGEFSAPVMKPEQSANGQGIDVKIEAEAGGIIRRLLVGGTLQSAIYRQFSTYTPSGWWHGEDSTGADTDVASSGTTGVAPAAISGITFAGFDDEIPGSAGVMECSNPATFVGTCKAATSTGEAHFYCFFKFPSIPAGDVILFSWKHTGTAKRIDLVVGNATYNLIGYSITGSVLFNNTTLHGAGATPDRWIAYHSRMIDNAGNVDVTHEWHAVGTALYYSGGVVSFAGVTRVHTQVSLNGGATMDQVRFCHVMLSMKQGLEFFSGTPTVTIGNIAKAFSGELADSRFRRICAMLGVTPIVVGALDDSEPMGAEPIGSGMNALYQIPEVDGGILSEVTDQPAALEYRTRKSLYNQYGIQLSYAKLAKNLESTPDDNGVANDIILSRVDGGSARATLEFGPMSIQPPPNGINQVPDDPEINNELDSRLPLLVQQQLLVRTWPNSRYPEIAVDLHHPNFTGNTALNLQAIKTAMGDIITVDTLPTFMAPDPLYLMVRGETEELYSQNRSLIFNSVPYGPYQSSELDTIGSYRYYAAHTTVDGVVMQQLNAGINSSVQTFAIKTLRGVYFTTATIGYNIKIGGETMTVLGMSSSSNMAVVDGTFETGSVGSWTATGGSLVASQAQAFQGTWSALLTVSGSPANALMRDHTTVPAVNPQSFKVGMWVRCSVARNVLAVIDFYNGAAYISSAFTSTAVLANTWTFITASGNAPATTTRLEYGPTMDASPANGTTLFVDNLDITRTDADTTTQLATVTRGVVGGFASAHNANDYVYVVPTLKARL